MKCFAILGFNHPTRCRFIVSGAGHAGIELNIAAQIKTLSHMVDVAQDLRLRGIAFAPAPFLFKLW
jgi:hypothetical protein